MRYFVLFHSAFCLLGGLNTLREGFVTERDNGATFEFLSGTKILNCEMSKWTEWSSCRQLGTACRNIQTRLRHCFKGYDKTCCEKARRHLSQIRKCENFEVEWSAWSPCSKTCGPNASRSRSAQNCYDQQDEKCASDSEQYSVKCPELTPITLKTSDDQSGENKIGETGGKSGLWWPSNSTEKLEKQEIKLEEKFSMTDFVPVLKLIEALGPDAIKNQNENSQCESKWEKCYHQVTKKVENGSIGQKWTMDEQATSTECISFETKSSNSSVCFCF